MAASFWRGVFPLKKIYERIFLFEECSKYFWMITTFVIFYYDIFTDTPDRLAEVGIKLHYLATWWDVLAACKELGRFDSSTLDSVEAFLHNPRDWSKGHGGI